MRQIYNSQTNKIFAAVRTYLWKVILRINLYVQGINVVSSRIRTPDIFDIPSLRLLYETHKNSCIFGNIVVLVRSNFMANVICLDRPVVVKPIETYGEEL